MDGERAAALACTQELWDELDRLSAGTALTLRERNELTKARLAVETLIDSLSYPQGMDEEITEASFPSVGRFQYEELESLTVRKRS